MKPFFALLALLVWGHGRAEQLYLLYEASCGNRIVYGRTVSDRPQMDYLAYSFTLIDGSTLILETDTEGMSQREELPAEYERCTESLRPEIAERINTGSLQVLLLTATDQGGYDQQPVMMASTILRQGGRVLYTSPLTAFGFSPDNVVIGENLDRGGEGASVFFDGREGSSCSSAFLFQQQHPGSAYPTINYKMLPQIGILEREMLGAGNYSGGDLITAKSIDGRPVDEYLAALCHSVPTQQEYTDVQRAFVPYYEDTPVARPAVVTATTDQAPPQRTAPAPAAPAPQVNIAATLPGAAPPHRVAPGETLYGIARRYGLSVEVLKGYNGLASNTIHPGQELIVGDPGVEATPRIAATPPPPTAAEVARPVRESPTPYGGERLHIVQPGETMASLALRYGYTTARFREFNGLGSQEVARVGQRLKTSHCNCPPEAADGPYLMAYMEDVSEPSSYVSPAPYDYGRQTEVPVAPNPQPTVHIVVPPARPVTGPEVGGPPAYRPPGGEPAPEESVSPPAQRHSTYVVQQGDNLFSIARRYGTTVDELRSLNGLLPADVIVPYQKLYVN